MLILLIDDVEVIVVIFVYMEFLVMCESFL